jgi:hypothetical protein
MAGSFRGNITLSRELIPLIGMADIVDRDVVVLAPEEGDGGKSLAVPEHVDNSLMGMLMDPQGLHASFERQAGSKAPGVDGMRKADYAEGLPERLADLSARLRRLGYRPKPHITPTSSSTSAPTA